MTRSTADCGMVELPGGEFQMGSDRHYLEDTPPTLIQSQTVSNRLHRGYQHSIC